MNCSHEKVPSSELVALGGKIKSPDKLLIERVYSHRPVVSRHTKPVVSAAKKPRAARHKKPVISPFAKRPIACHIVDGMINVLTFGAVTPLRIWHIVQTKPSEIQYLGPEADQHNLEADCQAFESSLVVAADQLLLEAQEKPR